tara:strand:- start:1975 stop:2193 length:219 start_codon:yes stop_codon:yes gene_type:complete
MSIESRLYIEKNPNTDEYQIKIVVGIFTDKQDALNHASFVALTKSIDFTPEQLAQGLEEILEVNDLSGKTIH